MSSSAAPAVPSSKYMRNADGHYVCPHCGKVTEKQNTMYYHMKKNHENDLKFECKKCEACPKFLQKSAYLHHLASVHPEDPHPSLAEKNPYADRIFTCPCCPHTAHAKANVVIHFARSHCKSWIPAFAKGEECTGCHKSFASSSAYLYHSVTCFRNTADVKDLGLLDDISKSAAVPTPA